MFFSKYDGADLKLPSIFLHWLHFSQNDSNFLLLDTGKHTLMCRSDYKILYQENKKNLK